jgi:hypothetical protein
MLIAIMAAAVAAGTPAPATGVAPICRDARPELAAEEPWPEAKLKRLDELPPANLILTVLREEDGCIVPVIVRYGIGAPAKPDH